MGINYGEKRYCEMKLHAPAYDYGHYSVSLFHEDDKSEEVYSKKSRLRISQSGFAENQFFGSKNQRLYNTVEGDS